MKKVTVTSILADVANDAKRARVRAKSAKNHAPTMRAVLYTLRHLFAKCDTHNAWISTSSYSDRADFYVTADLTVDTMKSIGLQRALLEVDAVGWFATEATSDYVVETFAERSFKYTHTVNDLRIVLSVNARLRASGEACRIEQVGTELEEKPVFAIRCE